MFTNGPIPAPRAVLFDLDGTLLDSIELIVRSLRYVLDGVPGAPRERAALVRMIGRPLVNQLRDLAPERVEELTRGYREYNLAHHDELVALYPGVDALLAGIRARGLVSGIVTSKSRATAELAFRRFGLDSAVDLVVTEDDTPRHKPEPDPLLHAAARLAIEPHRCWYVGDSTHDLEAASAASMTGIAAGWGPYAEGDLLPLAAAIASEPREVLALLDIARTGP